MRSHSGAPSRGPPDPNTISAGRTGANRMSIGPPEWASAMLTLAPHTSIGRAIPIAHPNEANFVGLLVVSILVFVESMSVCAD
jgi:hypothetical protein